MCVRRSIGQKNSSLANSHGLIVRMRVDEVDCVSRLIATKRKTKFAPRCEMEAMSYCCADGGKKSKSKRERYQNWRPWMKRETNKLSDGYPTQRVCCQRVFSCIPIWMDLFMLPIFCASFLPKR